MGVTQPESMQGGDWYRTPIFEGGPDPMTAAKIGACFAGPWAAFAVSAVLLAVDTKDGVISGKHALVQGAVGYAAGLAGPGGIFVNIAASGIDYEANGSVGWDNDKFREGAIRNVASYALSSALGGAFNAENSYIGTGLSAGLSSGLMNGVEITSGGWGDLDLDYDKANWREHLVTGAAAGISAMINKKLSGKGNTGSEGSQYGNENGTTSYPEQWGSGNGTGWNNAFSQKVITGGINSMLMTAAYHAMDGEGFKNDYSQMNWNNMTFSAYDLGNFLGAQTNTWVKERQGYDKETQRYDEKKRNSSGWGEDALALMLEYSDAGEKALKGFFGKIGSTAVNLVTDFGESIVNTFRYGEFASNDSTVIKDIKANENFHRALQIAPQSEGERLKEYAAKYGTKDALKRYAVDTARETFDDALKSAKDLKGAEKFTTVVNKLRETYGDMKFYSEDQFRYSLAVVMDRLSKEFKGVITYGADNSARPFNDAGAMRLTSQIECAGLVVAAMNVFGMIDKAAPNFNYKSDKYTYRDDITSTKVPDFGNGKMLIEPDSLGRDQTKYTYVPGTYLKGEQDPSAVYNILTNSTLFTAIAVDIARTMDLTGAMGVLEQKGNEKLMNATFTNNGIMKEYSQYNYDYFDHLFISLTNNSSRIAESTYKAGVFNGIENRKISPNYYDRTTYYLFPNIPKTRIK